MDSGQWIVVGGDGAGRARGERRGGAMREIEAGATAVGARTSTTRGSALTPQQQSFGGQAVHADASFSGVHCQGAVGLRRDAKGYGAPVAACR